MPYARGEVILSFFTPVRCRCRFIFPFCITFSFISYFLHTIRGQRTRTIYFEEIDRDDCDDEDVNLRLIDIIRYVAAATAALTAVLLRTREDEFPAPH